MNKTNRIISLGYNCEISFRLEDYFNKLDSYLFSWSYECDRELFIHALTDIEGVFDEDNISLMDDHMFKCNKYNIKFHPRYEILPKFGDVTEKQIEDAKNELIERLTHLKQKTKDMFKDSNLKTFLLKVENQGNENNTKFISEVYNVLKEESDGNFILVAILEKKYITPRILELENDNLKIRSLKKFANVKHTDIFGDINGWNRIIKEFAVDTGKNFRKNLFDRRKEVIPAMVKNKVRKLLERY